MEKGETEGQREKERVTETSVPELDEEGEQPKEKEVKNNLFCESVGKKREKPVVGR